METVSFITRARSLGFSLTEIAAHMQSPHDDMRKVRLLSKMEDKISALDVTLVDLQARRATLIGLVRDLRRSVA